MSEKEFLQKQILDLYNNILLSKTDLFMLCNIYKEKFPEEFENKIEPILLEAPKSKRKYKKKKKEDE